MIDTQNEVDVLIVGAGPVGLLAALMLHRKGHRVVVAERQPAPYPLPRAVMLDHEARRILNSAGLEHVLEPILQSLTDGREGKACFFGWYDGNLELLTKIEHGLSVSGFPISSGFCQPQLEEIVLSHVIKAGIPIRRQYNLVDIVDGEEGCICCFQTGWTVDNNGSTKLRVEQISARFVIGADGANSTVRSLMDFEVLDRGFMYDWLVVDFLLKGPLPPRVDDIFAGQICDPRRPTTVAMSGAGRHRLEFMRLPNETKEELLSKKEELARQWGFNSENSEVERAVVYTFRARWATDWVKNRVLLAGDAAHQLPPFIGQGLNSGIRDVGSLVWRLDLILRGAAPLEFLQSYSHERVPHLVKTAELSIMLGYPICETDEEKSAINHRRLRENKAHPPARYRAGEPSTGCFQDHPEAGYLSLQRPLEVDDHSEPLFFDTLFGYGWRLVTFDAEPTLTERSRQFFETHVKGQVVKLDANQDVTGDYAEHFASLGSNCILVRPDFVVFGCCQAHEADTLIQLLQRKAFPLVE